MLLVPPGREQAIAAIRQAAAEGRFNDKTEPFDPVWEPQKLQDNILAYVNTLDSPLFKLKNRAARLIVDYWVRRYSECVNEIRGLDKLSSLKGPAFVTSNHFNPFDSFTVEKVFKMSGKSESKRLYKVIREGNYTNFPGLYGFFFRNCDTLPLSSNKRTMVNFMKAVDTLLQKGEFILIYPEQSLWWNYRKPKPLKHGAFKMAARNNVPVVPIFITMQDSDKIGEDGYPIQEYTVNIAEPIYPNEQLSYRENIEMMLNKNFEVWKNIYEDFYGIPLEYTTKTEVKSSI